MERIVLELAAQLPPNRAEALQTVSIVRKLVVDYGCGGIINQIASQIPPDGAETVLNGLEKVVQTFF